MVAAFKSALGQASATTSGTTLAITTTAAIAINDLVVVRVASDNLTNTTPTYTATDSGGNAYTSLVQRSQSNTAGNGATNAILATRATAAVATGGTITVTLSGAVVARAAYAESFTGASMTVRATNSGTQAAAVGTSSGAISVQIGDLVLATAAIETSSTVTPDADTTGGAWSTMRTVVANPGTSATSMTLVGQWRIPNTAVNQTHNVNWTGVTDWASVIVALVEAAVVVPPTPAPGPIIPAGAPWRFFDAPMPSAANIHDEICDTDGWRLAIEGFIPEDYTGIVVWDGPAWDHVSNFWIDGEFWADVAGDLMGITHRAGRQDIDSRMEAAELSFTLDNRSGRYTQFVLVGGVPTTDQFFPGRRVAFWQDRITDPPDVRPNALYAFPRFFGYIETWDEQLGTPEGFPHTIDVVAVDGFERLNTSLDSFEWTMGAEADNPYRRMSSLLDMAGWPTTQRRRLDQGNVTLISKVSTNPILEEMHHTADSDGGVCYIDTEGTFMYRDRRWVFGRDDQMLTPAFDDNCASSDGYDFASGDPVVDTTDVVNAVRLNNDSGGIEVFDSNAASLAKYGRHLYPDGDGMLWRLREEGLALAAHILSRRADLYWRYTELKLYPNDTNDLWRVVTDLRIGDELILRRTISPGQQMVATCIIEGFNVEMTQTVGVWEWTLHLSKGQ